MNIQSLMDKIYLFEDLVVESGFKRNLQDSINAIQQGHNRNIGFMQAILEQVKLSLENMKNNGLEHELNILLRSNTSFFNLNSLFEILELLKDSKIDSGSYFSKLNSILGVLNNRLGENINEINNLKNIFSKFIEDKEVNSESNSKFISIIFKDFKTIHNLKKFYKMLKSWDQALHAYTTLVRSESPEEIILEEIQNGSIDVVLNINVDIALNLVDLIKIGVDSFLAYLAYKVSMKDVINAGKGNPEIEAIDKKREELMLNDIQLSLQRKMHEQHNIALEKKLVNNSEAIDKKIDLVSRVIAHHIVLGNEVKLLVSREVSHESNNEVELAQALKNKTTHTQNLFKQLPTETQKLLVDKYSISEQD